MTETIPHDSISERLAAELGLRPAQAGAALRLFDEGATIPFVARYRKETTDNLDEVALTALRDGAERLRALDKRREAIIAAMTERGQLTPELSSSLAAASSLTALEDIYLPYRPRRVTRAAKARERGLAPLAEVLLAQRGSSGAKLAAPFVNEGKGVTDVASALAGARDIIAESMSEDRATRTTLRDLFVRRATLRSKVVRGKEEEGATYRDHFDRSEHAAAAPAHRLLAMFRGEREGVLDLRVRPDDALALHALQRRWLRGTPPCPAGSDAAEVETALADAWQRLLAPSLENEFRNALRERADTEAIAVFAANLRELLLAPPLGPRRTLALDPGWRTGAKLVCLDAQGGLVHHDVIHPLTGGEKAARAAAILRDLCTRHDIEAVAVGNGTAGRETEAFVKAAGLPPHTTVALVDERGASVYSASDVARAEFPDHDITVRGAVSIGRRLMDPLAELVKVDPRSLGIGQYQHDVDQNALRRSLEEVVASCVNGVGVDVNTASPELLAYVSGIGPALAKAIVAWRAANGPFKARRDLLKVPRLGPKAFEQAAGFLRVRDGAEALDASAVHPESYPVVRRMAKDLGCTVADLMRDETLRAQVVPARYVDGKVGLPTLNDIMQELARPGRDPRPAFEVFAFADGVTGIDDVQPGMELPGIVTNVTRFGAFVDVGVHRDGLVHVSQLADRFVRDPAEVVAPGRKVRVRVLDVDRQRGRINMTLKGVPQND